MFCFLLIFYKRNMKILGLSNVLNFKKGISNVQQSNNWTRGRLGQTQEMVLDLVLKRIWNFDP